jgi:hypothetical protein
VVLGTLLAWCEKAGLAGGALLVGADGALWEAIGEVPGDDPGALARGLATALGEARRTGGAGPAAVAFDLGGRWVTAFVVVVPGGEDGVVAFSGAAPLRAELRAALAGWLEDGLRQS